MCFPASVWNPCVPFFLSPMDTSCAAGASWKLCLACSREGVLTQFSPVREGSGNVMQSGYVIAL